MIQLHEAPSIYEHIIFYDEEKQTQIRVVVSTFNSIEYLHVRKYYMDFDEEWRPSPEGIAMPLDFANSRELSSLTSSWTTTGIVVSPASFAAFSLRSPEISS